ncbi:hypothetical protein FCV25MIE_26533 [Fagus crenata]
MVVQVPQVDEEDEPTGFSTNSSVVTLWPPNKDEGDTDNDDLEWDDAYLMGRCKVAHWHQMWIVDRSRRRRRRMRVKDYHVADNDESDDADYNLLESYDENDYLEWSEDDDV